MAKLELKTYDGFDPKPSNMAKVTLSRRNLLALLHKLDMQHSHRRIENNVVYVDDELRNDLILVLCAEDDDEHYADPQRLGSRAGVMHPETETAINRNWLDDLRKAEPDA